MTHKEGNRGIAILMTRMDSNPQEFAGLQSVEGTSTPWISESRWDTSVKQVLAEINYRFHKNKSSYYPISDDRLQFLTDEELKEFDTKLKRIDTSTSDE
jgi:hypothetical protein